MSDSTNPDLNLREQIVRIDRSIAETHKFQAETNKLLEEGRKFQRERWLAPWSLVIALAGGLGLGLVQVLARLAGLWK